MWMVQRASIGFGSLVFVWLALLLIVSGCDGGLSTEKRFRYNPHLALRWPEGDGSQGWSIIDPESDKGEAWYRQCWRKWEGETIHYYAVVTEQSLRQPHRRDEKVTDFSGSDVVGEVISRTEMQHGPNKYPGVDILTRSDGKYVHRVIVYAWPTRYEVRVTSPKREWLDSPEVKAFLASLVVESSDPSRHREETEPSRGW
jgi:hypothetical protein